jgi:hypothetical protein
VVLARLLFPCCSLAIILVLVYDIWPVARIVRSNFNGFAFTLEFAVKLG